MDSVNKLKTEVFDSLQELATLHADWESLVADFPHSTIFCTWTWLVPWWRAFAGGDQLRILAVRDRSSSLVGLAPLALTTQRAFGTTLRILRLMGDGSHDSDNLDLPVRPVWEAQFSQIIFEWMEQQSNAWDVCQLRTLPAHSPVGNRLLSLLKARGWKTFVSSRPQSVVNLPNTWEAYLKRLSSKERGKIGLRARRLEKKYRVEIRKCTEGPELDVALKALFELHGKHWQLRGLPGTLHVPERRRFYRELAGLLLACRRLEMWVLEADGKIVATQFGLRHGDTVFSLQEGFDPEYSADSVGYVLRSQVLKNLIVAGIRKYDFLGGTDDSKLRWGAEVRSYLNLEFARPRTRGSLHLQLQYKRNETKAWLREHLPAAAWQTLKRLSGREQKAPSSSGS
jgi:CelD/BcsL family acetyltransferase involved in cellulose biosynthesis